MTSVNDFAIDGDLAVFPNNVQIVVTDTLEAVLPQGLTFYKRPLRHTDANESVGVFPTLWTPDEDSYEIRGTNTGSEPTISRYSLMIQGYIVDGDELRGLARHSVLSKLIRVMLYRSPSLALSLRALQVNLAGSVEKLQRYGIRSQRYISNDISGSWLYLSNTEFWFETTTE